jgi:DNA-binding NarL/FixJ family response regulator
MERHHLVRILIADDVAEWRSRFRAILQAKPEWQITGEACNGLQAIQRAAELRPDLVVLDVGMPLLNVNRGC